MVSRTLTLLAEQYAICQLPANAAIPNWAMQRDADFFVITQTKDELSLICAESLLPEDSQINADRGWYCLKLEGPFELNEPGVMASLVSPLAQAGLSVFAEATYDTDYILVNQIDTAIETFERLNYQVLRG